MFARACLIARLYLELCLTRTRVLRGEGEAVMPNDEPRLTESGRELWNFAQTNVLKFDLRGGGGGGGLDLTLQVSI